MYSFLTIVILIAAVLLILVVLVQNSKGGGLSAGFSSSNQVMGVRKTTDFIEKATWTLAGVVLALSIVAAAFLPRQEVLKSEISEEIASEIPVAAPGFDVEAAAPAIQAGDSAQ